MKRSKYWGMTKKNDAKLLASLRNSKEPFHKVTHREPGDIPGLTPALREGIYRPDSAAVTGVELSLRAHHYAIDIEAYINGSISKEQVFRVFERPIHGPYGEKL